jgi:hypothetical protein
MPSLDTIRAQSEAGLAALLRKFNARQRTRVMAAIRQYGSVSAIPESFWLDMQREIDQESAALMLLLLVGSYDVTAKQIPGARGLVRGSHNVPTGGIMSVGVRSAAAELGVRTAGEHVAAIRRRLQRNVDAKAIDLLRLPPEQAAGEVRKQIVDAMPTKATPGKIDPADSIAITRTTTGISAGQRSAAQDAERVLNAGDGATELPLGQTRVALLWQTEKDDSVCPVCKPLDGQPESVWQEKFIGGPPAHPNCRCQLSPVVTMERT